MPLLITIQKTLYSSHQGQFHPQTDDCRRWMSDRTSLCQRAVLKQSMNNMQLTWQSQLWHASQSCGICNILAVKHFYSCGCTSALGKTYLYLEQITHENLNNNNKTKTKKPKAKTKKQQQQEQQNNKTTKQQNKYSLKLWPTSIVWIVSGKRKTGNNRLKITLHHACI